MKKKNLFVLLAALVFVACLVAWWIHNTSTPQTLQELVAMPAAEFAANPALGEVAVEKETPLSLNPANVKQYLGQFAVPEKLFWHTKYEVFSGSTTFTSYAKYTKDGDTQRVVLYDNAGERTRNYKLTAKRVTINDYETGDDFTTTAVSRYTLDSILRVPDLAYFFAADEKTITDLHFELLDGKNVLCVEYTHPELNQTEKYWLSTEYGVPLLAESYIDGKLTVRTSTLEVNATGKPKGE